MLRLLRLGCVVLLMCSMLHVSPTLAQLQSPSTDSSSSSSNHPSSSHSASLPSPTPSPLSPIAPPTINARPPRQGGPPPRGYGGHMDESYNATDSTDKNVTDSSYASSSSITSSSSSSSSASSSSSSSSSSPSSSSSLIPDFALNITVFQHGDQLIKVRDGWKPNLDNTAKYWIPHDDPQFHAKILLDKLKIGVLDINTDLKGVSQLTHQYFQQLIKEHKSKVAAGQATHIPHIQALDSLVNVDATALPPPKKLVEIRGKQLLVNGEPFHIQGICYSPVPIGESVSFIPKGDYFTQEYAYIWQRDLPLIKAMGATAIRIYGWNPNADHNAFLDSVHKAGLKVLVTYYLGDAKENPVRTETDRNKIIIDFVRQVDLYKEHPAILMWSFGNELNGAWNEFTQQFSDAYGCWWTKWCAGYSDTNSDCQWQSTCMYHQLFSWINAAAKAAKIVTTRPIISGMADVDYMVGPTPWLDKVARFNYAVPDLDAWALQLYRGRTFGGYFDMLRSESDKPMIVTEFGVDAYNDPCGWPESSYSGGCFNMVGEGKGGDVAPAGKGFWGCSTGGDCGKPGVEAQVDWDMGLASELMAKTPENGHIVWGGFLMAWTDEFWKGGGTQDLCMAPCKTWDAWYCRGPALADYKPGGRAGCSWKAHFTCPNWDTSYHDLCGYWLAATPDNYVNEEWFGITTPAPCGLHNKDGGNRLDTLYIRPAFLGMQQLWTGTSEVDTSFTSCEALTPCWKCSTSHSREELKEGACEVECEIKAARVGPGSSKYHDAELEKEDWSHADFWAKYGMPLGVGASVITLAFVVSGVVVFRRWRSGSAEETRPLLPAAASSSHA